MQKEILTREKIKQDHNHDFSRQARSMLTLPIFLSFVAGLLVIVATRMIGYSLVGDIIAWLLGLLFVGMLLVLLYQSIDALVKHRKNYRTVENDEFEIVTDKLVNTQEESVGFRASRTRIYTLEFSSYGNYVISKENYHSSENYSMSDQGVFYTAKVGDAFYLVVDKNQRILLAYSTKFFELQE